MANQPNEGFTDNWAYLKTELSWLDRMLMMALSRYRQDKKEVDRVAQSKADKVSSHWWKGVISLDGKVAYDEHRPNSNVGKSAKSVKPSGASKQSTKVTVSTAKIGYQQQLDARLKMSHNNGIVLALPWFRDRLKLSLFEKNLVLMTLAPEVNRRYARLYRYLQSQDENPVTDLPTVELVLRLLCRNDAEWRRARTAFHPDAPLMRHGLLMSLNDSHDPFLNATLRLSDDFVDCLLSETPDPSLMDALLAPPAPLTNRHQPWPLPGQIPVEFSQELSIDHSPLPDKIERLSTSHPALIPSTSPEELTGADPTEKTNLGTPAEQSDASGSLTWDDLIIAPTVKAALKHLGHRLSFHDTVQQRWQKRSLSPHTVSPGLVALFEGPTGTGKTLAARVLAHTLSSTVYCVDLASVMDIDYFQLLDEIDNASPTVLLVKSSEQWLSRNSAMPQSRLKHFLGQRHKQSGLTIFTVDHKASVEQSWHACIDQTITFPLPAANERQALWKQAFPQKQKFSLKIDWTVLSNVVLSGQDIEAIAHDAMIRMLADGSARIKLNHLVEAMRWHHVADDTIQAFIDDCKLARKRALAAQSSAKASPAKSAKATSAKKAKRKAATPSSSGKRRRTTKAKQSAMEASVIPEATVAEEVEPDTNAETANPTHQTAQTLEPIDSTIQTPTP